jgi:hypothetical protein
MSVFENTYSIARTYLVLFTKVILLAPEKEKICLLRLVLNEETLTESDVAKAVPVGSLEVP